MKGIEAELGWDWEKINKKIPKIWFRLKSSLPSLGIEGSLIATPSFDCANSPAAHKGTSLWSLSGVHGSFPRRVLHTFQNQSEPPFALVSVTIPCNIFEGPQTMFKGAKLDGEIAYRRYVIVFCCFYWLLTIQAVQQHWPQSLQALHGPHWNADYCSLPLLLMLDIFAMPWHLCDVLQSEEDALYSLW